MGTWKPLVVAAVLFCRLCVLIFDILTLPFYALVDQPWNHWRKKRIVWAKLEDPKNPYSVFVRQVHEGTAWHLQEVNTIDELFRQAVSRNAGKRCYGVREVFGEEEVSTKSGKVFKKLNLGDYRWFTFSEIERRVDKVSKGLLSLGVQSKKPIVILAETRIEWIICAHACFRINVPIVTLYATLGEEGIAHGINQTEVSHVVTSGSLLPKLKKLLDKLPNVTHVVYMEDHKPPEMEGIPDRVKTLSFSELEDSDYDESVASYDPPTPDDLAILMYTSGSTGIPKGVMITNRNLVSSIKGFFDVIGTRFLRMDDLYVAYLPLAHVLELAAECYLSSFGIPIGYSTPQTLTDFSTAIKSGCKGDITVLKPTILTAVPLMLDRIRKNILQMAGKQETFSRKMFDFAVEYKRFWMNKGFCTPMIDRYLMKTYHDFVGGRVRIVICGGAPLSKDTQDFIRCCLNAQVIQGYGMTETAASATVMSVDDFSAGRVGAPLSTCYLRLVDWEDGRYHVTDKPNPRGEVIVGGDCVTLGYYKNEAQTQEAFKEENGKRWFYTGDIVEVLPNGTLQIIDRKNDLVKLQFGEYVALGKIEAELKTCPLVENICAFGSGLHSYMVALIVPNRFHLKQLAEELHKGHLSFSEMCSDEEITKLATDRIREHGTKSKLYGAELPTKIKLCEEEWTPDNGLVTAAMKIRRKMIQKHYQSDIDAMYHVNEMNGVAKSNSAY